MDATDSQTVQINISNCTTSERNQAFGERTLKRAGLFLFTCVLAATIVCCVLVFINSIASATNQKDSQSRSIPRPCENVPAEQLGEEFCTSQVCMENACEIANTVNISADPCENFYDFSCSIWLVKNVQPSYSPHWAVSSKVQKMTDDIIIGMLGEPESPEETTAYKQAKSLFKKCSDVDELDQIGLQPLWDLLEKYGGWPMLYEEGAWNSSNFDWAKSIADLKKFFDTSALIEIQSYQNTKNVNDNGILISQPSLFLDRPYLMDHQTYAKAISAYRDFIVNVTREFLAFRGEKTINETYLNAQASTVIVFESKIANLTRDAVELQYDMTNYSRVVTLKSLQQAIENATLHVTPFFRLWHILGVHSIMVHFPTLLHNLYANTGVNVTDDERLFVSDMNYFHAIIKVLAGTPKKLLANYLHFRMAARIVSGTTKRMRSYAWDFYNQIYGSTEMYPREYSCSALVQESFTMAIGYEYVKRHGKQFTMGIQEVSKMFTNIKESFRELLVGAEWMNDTVRNSSLQRLDNMQACIGYPSSWIENETRVHSDFDGLILNQTTYLEQVLSVRSFLADQKLKLLRAPFDSECEWSQFFDGPQYDLRRNTIHITFGILQRPFFDRMRPMSLNYGALGTIIGHEITHGLVYRGTGWTKESNGDFSPIGKCLINQYNQFAVEEITEKQFNIDGKMTLDENIADSEGLHGAYRAYKSAASKNPFHDKKLPGFENFSPEHLYFLGFAMSWCSSNTMESLRYQVLTDVHSPDKYRVIGTLRNSKEFAKA